MKKVTFGPRPTSERKVTQDAWVEERSAGDPSKRLTIDVSAALHRRMKTQCAARGVNMADVIRELLERRFPENAP
ncbi:MAG: hypothetical protein GC161_07740 [Planctomycetaceae bacterium]|nr:hypothetical protein [Planctomycetaceae bacterium]